MESNSLFCELWAGASSFLSSLHALRSKANSGCCSSNANLTPPASMVGTAFISAMVCILSWCTPELGGWFANDACVSRVGWTFCDSSARRLSAERRPHPLRLRFAGLRVVGVGFGVDEEEAAPGGGRAGSLHQSSGRPSRRCQCRRASCTPRGPLVAGRSIS